MVHRCLLHVNRVEEFLQWCKDEDLQVRDGKGPYQIAQILLTNGEDWMPIYKKANTRAGDPLAHVSLPDILVNLVIEFLRERKLKW